MIETLSEMAKDSMIWVVDRLVRENLGHLNESFTKDQLFDLMIKVKEYYDYYASSPQMKWMLYYSELSNLLNNNADFKLWLKTYIVHILRNRPTEERMDYYLSLIRKNKLQDKWDINKDKLERRIELLTSTDYRKQDFNSGTR